MCDDNTIRDEETRDERADACLCGSFRHRGGQPDGARPVQGVGGPGGISDDQGKGGEYLGGARSPGALVRTARAGRRAAPASGQGDADRPRQSAGPGARGAGAVSGPLDLAGGGREVRRGKSRRSGQPGGIQPTPRTDRSALRGREGPGRQALESEESRQGVYNPRPEPSRDRPGTARPGPLVRKGRPEGRIGGRADPGHAPGPEARPGLAAPRLRPAQRPMGFLRSDRRREGGGQGAGRSQCRLGSLLEKMAVLAQGQETSGRGGRSLERGR